MPKLLILLLALASSSLGCGGGDDAETSADTDGPVITPGPKGSSVDAFNDGLEEISAAEFERAENVNLEWADVQPASHEKPAQRGTDWEDSPDPPKRVEKPRVESDVRELPNDPFSAEPGGTTLPSADYLDDVQPGEPSPERDGGE